MRHTFSSVCGRCGAFVPDGSENCLVCATPAGAVPFEGKFPVALEERPGLDSARAQSSAGRKTQEIWQRAGIAVSTVIVLVLAVFTGFGVYREYFDTSSYRALESIVYETDGGSLMLSYPGLEQPWEVAGIGLGDTAFSDGSLHAEPGGRRLAYTSAEGGLYTIDLAQMPQAAVNGSAWITADKLADGLAEPAVFSGGGEYLVYINGKRELYASDMNGSWLLDTEVAELVAVEGRKVLYTRREDVRSGDQSALYINYLPRDGNEVLLVGRGVTGVLDWTSDFDKVLYTGVQKTEGDEEQLCLLSFDLRLKATATLAAGVGRIVDADAATGAAVYLVEQDIPWDYERFIDDDLAEEDAAMTEPQLEDYPALYEATMLYGDGADFTDLEEHEDLVEQSIEYRDAQSDWADKQERDKLRRRLRVSFAPYSAVGLYNLYSVKNGIGVLLADGVCADEGFSKSGNVVNVDEDYVLYERIDGADMARLKMSGSWDNEALAAFDPRAYFLNHSKRELIYSRLDGQSSRLYTRGGSLVHKLWRAAPGGGGVYFTVGSVEGGPARPDQLFYANVRSSSSMEAVLVATGVDSLVASFRDGVLYGTVSGGEPRLSLAQGANTRQLGGNGAVYGGLAGDGLTLLYYDGFAEQTSSGALHMFMRDDQLLAENVVDYDYRSDQLVYLQCIGEGHESPDLYIWRGGRLTLLEKAVRGAVAVQPDGSAE